MDMVIYLTEDKEDAEELRELGLATTTFGKSPGKWDETYSTTFSVLRVVIIANKDVPGRANAIQAAITLYGRVASLKLLELPDRDGRQIRSVIDWLAAGGTRNELEQLCDKEKEWQPSKKDNIAHLVSITGVQSETVEWLWYPYLPKPKLTILEGDPGVGKSWLSLAVAAAVSLGSGLPGQGTSPPASVLLASAEDGIGDTIRPRLAALGADMERIRAIEGPLAFDEEGLRILREFIRALRPALVIIDPLVAFMGAGIDLHRANQTRAMLSRLALISEEHVASILAVRHLAKGKAVRAIYRGLGSIDITAACRSVLLAGCDPVDPRRRALVHLKSNLAAPGHAVGYEIREDGFCWTGESSLTARQILASENSAQDYSALKEAVSFLKERLLRGPACAAAVFEEASACGISAVTLKRAKGQMNIVTSREGEHGRRGAGRFVWSITDSPDVQDLLPPGGS